MRRSNDILIISPRKVARDLVILGVLIGGGYWGIQVSGFSLLGPKRTALHSAFAPHAMPEHGAAGPEGLSPAALSVVTLFEPDSEIVAATLDGQEITIGMIDGRARTGFIRRGGQVDEGLKPSVFRDFLRVQAFYELVREATLDQAALERGLTVADDALEARLAETEASFGGARPFEEALAQMGSDREGMASLTRRNLLAEALQEQVVRDDLGLDPASPEAESAFEGWVAEAMQGRQVTPLDPAFKRALEDLVNMLSAGDSHGAGQPQGEPVPPHGFESGRENSAMDIERQ